MPVDSIVLGAGIVGVSIALQLQRRGHAVVLVDRRGAGEETSFGNAGLIQREGVHPHAFPRDLASLLKYARNDSAALHYHLGALPRLAPFLLRYWWHSAPKRYDTMVKAYAPLIAASLSEHQKLIEEAGADALVAKEGWYKLYRSEAARDLAFAEAELLAREFGIASQQLGGGQMQALEPDLRLTLAGAVHFRDPWTIRDPQALVLAYLRLFEGLGGRFAIGDATTLQQAGHGWRVSTADGVVAAASAVVALGPWADRVTRPLGYRLPLAVKRGYHMHYAAAPGTALRHSMLDVEGGYLLAPMRQGIRLTTGTEFAPRDAPPTPVQLGRSERAVAELFPLGERLEAAPWMGSRPATPDMMPIIGRAPRHNGLWFAFGHAHHGMTLGPATGRLVAELIGGETPFVDPRPFGAERFGD